MTLRRPNGKDRFEKALRWMEENIILASGIYQTGKCKLKIHPAITLTRKGFVRRSRWTRPRDWSGGMLNSTAALTCCCYIAALGKVDVQGRKDWCDRAVFELFLEQHMRDFFWESKAKRLSFSGLKGSAPHMPHPYRGKTCSYTGGNEGTATLYKIFRCGFVHSFWPKEGALVRAGASSSYWFPTTGKLCLNVDRLAIGVLKGIADFRRKFVQIAEKVPTTYGDFLTWISA